MDDSRLLSRLAQPKPENGQEDDELIAPGNCYATISGQRTAHAIEFIPGDADPVIVPYAYLPLLWPKRPDILLIEYPTLFTVLVQSSPPDILKRLIRDRRILWIRESTPAEAATLPVCVARIRILRTFPSRDAGDGGDRPGD